MGDSRKKSSWKPAAVVTSAAKELADQEILEDKSRRLGDTGMYGFYAKAAGRTTLAILLVSMSIYAFCGSFPSKSCLFIPLRRSLGSNDSQLCGWDGGRKIKTLLEISANG
jgi:hypothetical protein